MLRETTALPLGGLWNVRSAGVNSTKSYGTPLLQNPTVSIRIEKIGEARVVSARRIEPCGVASNPSIYRGFVPNGADLDAIFQQSNPRRLEVGHEKTTATKRAGERIPQPRAELDRATGAGRCKLNKAERIVWCVVDVNPKSDAVDVEAQGTIDVLTGMRDFNAKMSWPMRLLHPCTSL